MFNSPYRNEYSISESEFILHDSSKSKCPQSKYSLIIKKLLVLVSAFNVDPDFRFRLGDESEARFYEVVVVEGGLEAEVLQERDDDGESLELRELVAGAATLTDAKWREG